MNCIKMVDTNKLLFDDCTPDGGDDTSPRANTVSSVVRNGIGIVGPPRFESRFESTPMSTYELLRPSPVMLGMGLALNVNEDMTTTMVSKSSSTESEYGDPGCSTRLLEKDHCESIKVVQQPHGLCPPSPFAFHSVRTPNTPVFFRPLDVSFVHWNWPGIRLVCLVCCSGAVFGVLCLALALFLGLRAGCMQKSEWWKGVVMYEIFPASFQDTDGDGFGDMNGILHRLDYIENMGVKVVRLNSVFSALDYPLEYEHVIDFQNIDPHLGRIEHFERLVIELHRRDIRVVLELNPTVTSDQHTWAAHWLLNTYPEYEGFYLNMTEFYDEFYPPSAKVDVIDMELPQRIFGSQVFLNWTNRAVQREMSNMLRFWLHKGVDGFYFKHLDRMKVSDDRELLVVLSQWRHLANHFSRESDSRRMLMCSMTFLESLRDRDSHLLPALAELFDLVDVPVELAVNGTGNVEEQLRLVEDWARMVAFPRINWNVGSSETFRLASRMIPGYNLAAIFLLLSMPGSATIYYGDEIELQDSFDEVTQKIFRSGQLCPMQWSNSANANFTIRDSLPWLPLHPDFKIKNALNLTSTISDIRSFVDLRNQSYPLFANRFPSQSNDVSTVNQSRWVRRSDHNLLYNVDGVLALERFYPRHPRLVVCLNLGDSPKDLDLSNEFHVAQVKVATDRVPGEKFNRIALAPGEAVIAEILE